MFFKLLFICSLRFLLPRVILVRCEANASYLNPFHELFF